MNRRTMWVVLCVVLCVVPVLCYDCNIPDILSTSPKLPTLPDQYETYVEANIKQKGKSIEVREYYDYLNNRASISLFTNAQLYRSIINLQQMERYDIHPDGTCRTADLNKETRSIYGFIVGNGSSHVDTVTDILKFGKQFNESYIGTDEIRGIPVNHWRSCQYWKTKNASFTLDYYYSSPDYLTASGHKEIPIRAVVNGIALNVDSDGNTIGGNHNFSHVYEFVFFRPGPVKDWTVFEVPQGIVCEGRKETLVMPRLPNQFSLHLEIDTPYTSKPLIQIIYFDYEYGLIRSDDVGLESIMLTKIEDYKSGVEYIIKNGNCTVQSISNESFGSLQLKDNKVKMRHGEELLKYNNRTYIYQGQRLWRGLVTDAWANQTKDGVIQEILFLNKNFNLPEIENPDPVLVGFYMKNISSKPNKSKITNTSPFQTQNMEYGKEMFVHFFDYKASHSTLDIYDVSSCYSHGHQKLNVILRMHGDGKVNNIHRSYFRTVVRYKLSMYCKVIPLRIAELQILDSNSHQTITLYFSILDKPPISSDNDISMREAYKNLKSEVKNKTQFSIEYDETTENYILDSDSISLVVDETSKSTNDDETSKSTSLSAGAITGIVIGVLVIGVSIGIITLYKKHRRKSDDATSVPYTRNID